MSPDTFLRRVRAALHRRARRLRRRAAPSSSRPAHPAPHRAALTKLDGELRHIVLVVGRGGLKLAAQLARERPSVVVHLLAGRRLSADRRAKLPANVQYAHCPDDETRLRRLAQLPQPQLIIERGLEHTGERVATFQALFGLLTDGGRYVIDSDPALRDDAAADPEALAEAHRMEDLLADLAAQDKTERPGEHPPEVELGLSVGSVQQVAGGWVVAKRRNHQWKLRDRRANRVLDSRYGAAWGEVIATKPGVVFPSRARGVRHGEGLRQLRTEITVPDRWLRRYSGAICYARKRARLADHWLPDTFRNQKMRVLSHRALHSISPTMARVAGEPEEPKRRLEGAYFYLDSEYFSHFGHVLTDVVGNTWGWELAQEQNADIRPLLSLPGNQASMPGFQRQIFTALGIDPDAAEYVQPGEPVWVEELYGCTSDWAMPRYAAPELAEIWARIAAGCRSDLSGTPELIFVSRRPRAIRTCLNADEVEEFFVRLGFTILYPEDLPFGDQIATFANARIIAGFAGSGMFNTMFAPNATVLILTCDSYTATNEYLIKALVGGDIHYFWTPGLLQHPESGWTWEAFRSNFVFDLERFAPAIADVARAATSQ